MLNYAAVMVSFRTSACHPESPYQSEQLQLSGRQLINPFILHEANIFACIHNLIDTYMVMLYSYHLASANVSFSTGIDGEKKYSPPFGTTHCAPRSRLSPWLNGSGSEPLISRTTPAVFVWPIMASKPGTTGSFWMGNLVLFAQPARN